MSSKTFFALGKRSFFYLKQIRLLINCFFLTLKKHTGRLTFNSSFALLFLRFFFSAKDFSTFGSRHLACLRMVRSAGVKVVGGGCHVSSLVSSSSELVIAGYTNEIKI